MLIMGLYEAFFCPYREVGMRGARRKASGCPARGADRVARARLCHTSGRRTAHGSSVPQREGTRRARTQTQRLCLVGGGCPSHPLQGQCKEWRDGVVAPAPRTVQAGTPWLLAAGQQMGRGA